MLITVSFTTICSGVCFEIFSRRHLFPATTSSRDYQEQPHNKRSKNWAPSGTPRNRRIGPQPTSL